MWGRRRCRDDRDHDPHAADHPDNDRRHDHDCDDHDHGGRTADDRAGASRRWRPQDGIVRKTVQKGDRVVLVVTSDVADHVHLHGYDIMRDVAAGGTARIRFRATVPGRFEVELEDRGAQIADLTVEP